MSFRVWENQTILLAKDISTKEEAIEIARANHGFFPDKYHEVYRVENGKSLGVAQWKPGDPVRRSSQSETK